MPEPAGRPPLSSSPHIADARHDHPPLTPLERRALDLGRLDARQRARPARVVPVLRLLFGLEPLSPLADPRLEALRRFAMRSVAPDRHRPATDEGEDDRERLDPELLKSAQRSLGQRDADAGPVR